MASSIRKSVRIRKGTVFGEISRVHVGFTRIECHTAYPVPPGNGRASLVPSQITETDSGGTSSRGDGCSRIVIISLVIVGGTPPSRAAVHAKVAGEMRVIRHGIYIGPH